MMTNERQQQQKLEQATRQTSDKMSRLTRRTTTTPLTRTMIDPAIDCDNCTALLHSGTSRADRCSIIRQQGGDGESSFSTDRIQDRFSTTRRSHTEQNRNPSWRRRTRRENQPTRISSSSSAAAAFPRLTINHRHAVVLLLLIATSSAVLFCSTGAAAADNNVIIRVSKRQVEETTTTTEPATVTTALGGVDEPSPSSAPTTTTTTTTSTTAAPETTTLSGSGGEPVKAKIPPINYTHVDELFNQVLEDSEVALKWKRMDRTLVEGVRGILKIIFPHIVSMASDAKVSGNCSGAILKWILNLRNLRTWAVQMLDSIGKPGAGILEGSLTLFGNYKQCLGIRAPDEDEIELADGEFREYFRGQYCVLQLRPPLVARQPFYSLNSTIPSLMRKSYKYYEKTVYDDLSELAMAFNFVSIRADLCVPSLCSRDDIQRVADFLAKKVEMRARVQRCDIEPQEDQTLIDQSHLIWSMIFIILLLLVLISTLTSMIYKLNAKRSCKSSKTKSIFTSMSVYRSLAHMKNVHLDRINDSKPVFLYSLRLLIIFWISLITLVSQLDFQYLRELLSLRDVIMLWPMQLIVNSSLAFDSLILLTAFTYSYQNINANVTDLIKYNLSKYSRLMPSIMLFVALTIITPLLYPNRSPVWHDFVDEPAQVCKSSGIVNLFFLQNLLQSNQICLPQTWIFCVELQLCILAIPLVHAMNKQFDAHHGRFKLLSLPIVALILLALAGCVINFVNIFQNSLPAAWFLTYPDKADKTAYFSAHLYKTWSHLTSFSVGLLMGHLCRCLSIETFSGRPYGRKCCDGLMWATSLCTMTLIIFSTHSWSLSGRSHLEAPLLSALYAALAPLLWSISWSLILFHLTVPNEQNQRSCLTQLLTSDVNLVRVGRLSFLVYLIGPYVNNFVLAVQEQAIFTSVLMLGHTLIGNFVITFAISFLVSALVELPCRRLFKKLLLGSRRHCTNLDIISRQLNIRAQNQGPSHDHFAANANAAHHQQQQQQKMPLNHHNHHQNNSSSVMIPLK